MKPYTPSVGEERTVDAMVISFGLSVSEVKAAIRELEAYQRRLNEKCKELSRRLAERGAEITKAEIASSSFGRYIRVGTEISPEQYGCKAVFFMEDAEKITEEWQTKEGIKTAEVSPSLMIEFGSGLNAQNPAEIPGVGTGTFPGGTHGTEPVWYWMDLDGNWNHSSGVKPRMPLYNAAKKLRDEVLPIAREVFKEA